MEFPCLEEKLLCGLLDTLSPNSHVLSFISFTLFLLGVFSVDGCATRYLNIVMSLKSKVFCMGFLYGFFVTTVARDA